MENCFNLVKALLVERANLDANLTTMVFRKIWETCAVIENCHKPVVMLDGFIIKCIWRTVTDTAFIGLAEFQHPSMFITIIDR